MTHSQIIRELVRHTKNDFISYFSIQPFSERATMMVEMALTGGDQFVSRREEVEAMIPDTEDDGSWECSYALNTGLMMLYLIDYETTKNEDFYNDAVTLFFDTVDFKTQQDLESQGILQPTEEQIGNHELFAREKAWFEQLVGRSEHA